MKITLIAAAPSSVPAPNGEEYQQESLPGWVPFVGKPVKVDLKRLRSELDGVQLQIEELLRGISSRNVDGMALSQIEVSLAISAQGSIGIATAGAEVSLTLVFARS